MKYLLIILTLLMLASCGSSRKVATKPVPTTTATLNGSKSYDPDGYIVKWWWRQITPGNVVINNPSGTITPIIIKKRGVYQFELTVTDNQGAIGKDTAKVIY